MIEDIKKQLLELGMYPGDVVLMHSSMKALKTNKSPTWFSWMETGISTYKRHSGLSWYKNR